MSTSILVVGDTHKGGGQVTSGVLLQSQTTFFFSFFSFFVLSFLSFLIVSFCFACMLLLLML